MLAKYTLTSLRQPWSLALIPFRSFSRADIIKSLDKSKISRRAFIKGELTSNPEFFKAYPHLQTIFQYDEEKDQLNEKEPYHHDSQVVFKDFEQKTPYFESLLHQQNQYMKPQEKEELIRENEKNFIESYGSPHGPSKYISPEQLLKMHQQIDRKMQELEDSGLTREEVLYDKQFGIPLVDDPFFQFVKNNKAAREMLIKPGEEFSVERVIEKALRQDVGPDPTLAMNNQNYKFEDTNNPMFPMWEYKKKYRDRDPTLNPEAYFYDHKLNERRQRQFNFDQEKPATFINRPLSRSQLRKKFMRNLRKQDIDWRDTALLTKFMNDTGKIYNRFQSRLRTSVQRKMAKTIKKVRDLFLISHVGLIKPTDRVPLGSFIEDLEEMHKKTIDPVTGRMFLKHSLQDDLPTKEKRIHEAIEKRFAHVETKAEYADDLQAEIREQIIREMSLDNEKLIPDRKQRQWLAAQSHIVERDGLLDEAVEDAELAEEEFMKPNVEFMGAKQAFDDNMKKIQQLDLTPDEMFDTYLTEKSLNVHQFDQGFDHPTITQLKEQAKRVDEIKKTDEESDDDIRKRIEKLMKEYANPKFNKDYFHDNELEKNWSIKERGQESI